MKILSYIACAILLFSCTTPKGNESFDALIKKSPLNAIMFIAPDCPLCISLSKPYLDLKNAHSEIQFIVVHSGEHYDPMELNMFANKTGLKTNVFKDRDYAVAHQFNATITPEFFLVDSSYKILYQGLLDDRMVELGSPKQNWSQHYFEDAINATLNGQKVKVSKTKAVGCVLEY